MCSQCYLHISPPCVIFLIKNPWCSITTFAQKTFGMGVLMHHASRHNQKCAKKSYVVVMDQVPRTRNNFCIFDDFFFKVERTKCHKVTP